MRTSVAAALAALALAAPSTLAAGGDPIASTGSASSVTATGAVISGTVNPNGSATTYQVQYGTSGAYGSATAPGSAGSGTTATTISVPIGGLAPDTTYHYRVTATNPSGTGDGTDATFTTAKAPPSLTPLAPGSVTATSALAAASVNPNGVATNVTFQYGHTTAYGSTSTAASAGTGTSPVRVQATIAGLLPGTSYHYRAVATSADGTTYGTDTAFATAKAAPAASTGAASVVLTDGARLTGTVAPAGVETSYQFQYGPTAAYGQQTALTVAGSGSSKVGVGATIGGLAAGTTYHYRLVAISADGTTAGADAAFTTTGDAASPGGPLPPSSVQLDGAINPPAKSTTWWFEYGPSAAYGSESIRQSMSGLGARPVNVRLAGLAASTTFHYRLELQTATGLYVGPDETFATKGIVRARPEGLTLTASARTRSHTVSVSASGTLRSSLAGECNGVVEVSIARGADIISLRSVPLRADCTYTERVSLHRSATGHRVTVLARFTGNATLLAQAARRVLVSIG
jgi:phosphodiesterase/alkaline phosphatase D-like protein